MGWKCIGVGFPPKGPLTVVRPFFQHNVNCISFRVSAQWQISAWGDPLGSSSGCQCVCLCRWRRGRSHPPLRKPLGELCFLTFSSCYCRSSSSASSWMTWMSSEEEVDGGRLGLSDCCCCWVSLAFSSSTMVFFHTLWFSVKCCMMLQNNRRWPFLLSVRKTTRLVWDTQVLAK